MQTIRTEIGGLTGNIDGALGSAAGTLTAPQWPRPCAKPASTGRSGPTPPQERRWAGRTTRGQRSMRWRTTDSAIQKRRRNAGNAPTRPASMRPTPKSNTGKRKTDSATKSWRLLVQISPARAAELRSPNWRMPLRATTANRTAGTRSVSSAGKGRRPCLGRINTGSLLRKPGKRFACSARSLSTSRPRLGTSRILLVLKRSSTTCSSLSEHSGQSEVLSKQP